MSTKEEKIEVEGEVVEALPNTMFTVQIDGGHDVLATISCAAGSSTGTGEEMKVRPSVKPMCERCRVIKRHGRTMVICTNPRHKQRQG